MCGHCGLHYSIPGARNVICERVVFSLDLRSIRQEDLREIAEEMELYGAELSSLHGVEVSLRPDQALPPMPLS